MSETNKIIIKETWWLMSAHFPDLYWSRLQIYYDNTAEILANELVNLGVPHQQIVLAFKTVERRRITDFAIY